MAADVHIVERATSLSSHRMTQSPLLSTVACQDTQKGHPVQGALFANLWSRLGSNQRPSRCERDALPLSHGTVPLRSGSNAKKFNMHPGTKTNQQVTPLSGVAPRTMTPATALS